MMVQLINFTMETWDPSRPIARDGDDKRKPFTGVLPVLGGSLEET